MAKYIAIYMAPVSEVESWMASTTPEQRKAGAQEWEKWSKDHARDLADAGGPLGKTKRISQECVADVANDLGAVTVVRASSHEAAAAMFEGHPHFSTFPGEAVEVMPVLPVPGT